VGLSRVSDPFSSTDKAFTQMTGLLNAAGLELATLFHWQALIAEFTFNTTTDAPGQYVTLPADWNGFVDQTGWDLNNEVPLIGPLNTQQWAYLKGRSLASETIYVSFRINDDALELYPEPPPADIDCSIRYLSRNWARNAASDRIDFCSAANDTVLLDSLLTQKFLKVKFLEAKNLPSAAARMEFENVLQNRRGADQGAQVLNAGHNAGRFPYLNTVANTPDTNFGL
jgi:hypothetical protein